MYVLGNSVHEYGTLLSFNMYDVSCILKYIIQTNTCKFTLAHAHIAHAYAHHNSKSMFKLPLTQTPQCNSIRIWDIVVWCMRYRPTWALMQPDI